MTAGEDDSATGGVFGQSEPTRLAVALGPLVRPVLSRMVGIGASRAELPLDRLDDALMLADVIAATAPALTVDGRIELSSRSIEGRLELRLGPLRAGGVGELLAVTSGQPSQRVIGRLASDARIVATGDGEMLVIELAP